MGKNYLENFVQSTFTSLKSTGVPIEGGTLVVSGDGRYYNKDRQHIAAERRDVRRKFSIGLHVCVAVNAVHAPSLSLFLSSFSFFLQD